MTREDQRILPDYADLEPLFQDPSVTFTYLAGLFGVSRERIRQVHRDHFSHLIDGRGRQRHRTAARRLSKYSWNSQTQLVADAATRIGLSVQPVLQVKGEKRQNRLIINDLPCGVQSCFTPMVSGDAGPGNEGYYRFQIRNVKAFARILLCGPDKLLYVIPQYVIDESGMGDGLYIPVKRLPTYNNIYPRVDWMQYKDAWWVLGADK